MKLQCTENHSRNRVFNKRVWPVMLVLKAKHNHAIDTVPVSNPLLGLQYVA